MKCFRASPSIGTPIMGHLQAIHVMSSRSFSKTGVDYAGPFMCNVRNRRNIKPFELYCYFYLFFNLCCSSCAVHLELISDLSIFTFLAALKRFVARRGKPAELTSHCATNFKGASRELQFHTISSISRDHTFQNYEAKEGIIWEFNPPSAPYICGL